MRSPILVQESLGIVHLPSFTRKPPYQPLAVLLFLRIEPLWFVIVSADLAWLGMFPMVYSDRCASMFLDRGNESVFRRDHSLIKRRKIATMEARRRAQKFTVNKEMVI